jgi:hypothetical protein
MKTSSFILSFAVAAVTIAEAQYYNITSPPFHLFVTSDDGKVHDTVSACHIGAALESLCLSHADYGSAPNPLQGAEFNFNTTVNQQAPAPGFGMPGILTYFLRAQPWIPSSVFFSYNPTDNLVLPVLGPGDSSAQSLSFNAQDELTLQGYVVGNNTGTWKEYYRWYACADTYYSGYRYSNLAWGLGAGKPDNPSCVAVNVTRKFI